MSARTLHLYVVPSPGSAAMPSVGKGFFSALFVSLPLSVLLWYGIFCGIARMIR